MLVASIKQKATLFTKPLFCMLDRRKIDTESMLTNLDHSKSVDMVDNRFLELFFFFGVTRFQAVLANIHRYGSGDERVKVEICFVIQNHAVKVADFR